MLTTLHGSTGTLEVNGLGGFYSSVKNGSQGGHYNTPVDPMLNGYGRYPDPSGGEGDMGVNPMNHSGPPAQQQFHINRSHSVGGDEDLTDVLQGLSLNNSKGGPNKGGYNRGPAPVRRTSAPTQTNGPMLGWPESIIEEPPVFSPSPTIHQSKFMTGFTSGWNSSTSGRTVIDSTSSNGGGMPPPTTYPPPHQHHPPPPPPTSSQPPGISTSNNNGGGDSIWSPTFSSRPESELSSYQDSDGSNGFSPIYSPVSAVTSGFFEPFPVMSSTSQQTSTSTQFMVSLQT